MSPDGPKLVSQPYQSAHLGGYYDVDFGAGMRRRRSLSVLGGGAVSWLTVTGAQQPLKIVGFLRAGADAWIPMVASLEQRLTQSRSLTLSQRREPTEKHYG